VTYLNLELLFAHQPQPLGIVALDGIPLLTGGGPGPAILWRERVGVPPGSRVEFVMRGPPAGVAGLLVTHTVDTGQGGENDPNRALIAVDANDAGPELPTLPAVTRPLSSSGATWLGNVKPARVRKL
jgi:hypothetical protein